MRSGTKLAIFFSVFAAFGIFGTAIGVGSFLEAQDAQSWPTTIGTITDNYISQDWQSGDQHSQGQYVYYPNVVYDYSVNGVQYTGTRIGITTGGSSDRSYAEGVLSSYNVGALVTVHYNPNDPSRSVLEVGGMGQFVFVLIPLIFVVIGVGGVAYGLRSNRTAVPSTPIQNNSSAYAMPALSWSLGQTDNIGWDEHVLWKGTPVRAAYLFTGKSTWMLGGGLFFFAFAFVWTTIAFLGNAPFPAIAIGLAFVGIGIFSIAMVPRQASKTFEGTEYVLTEKRLIVKEGGEVPTTHSLELYQVGFVSVRRNPIDYLCHTGSIGLSKGSNDLRGVIEPYKVREQILAAAAHERTAGVMEQAY
ncbi:MAG TPA: DUF3592 domain-containing protein [Methanomassiliicoccales archaeon]|nr:DUF3592 domain-containing protein [Methanomassiliicoccales archaeon]